MSALKQVFPRVYFRYDQDRYAQDLEQFAAWLLANGYRNKTARTHLFRAQQALRAVGGPPGAALQADVLRRTFQRLRQRRWRKCTTHSTFAGYLRSVGRLADFPAPIPTRTEALLEDFLERLGRRRGLATSTICNYRIWVSDFLRRSLRRGSSIEGLSSRSVERYIQTRAPQLARVTFLTAIKCIQAFLRFCHERVALAERLDLIDLPRRFGAERPPRAMPWADIEQLLASIDRTRRSGARDYMILHLMAYYGLRTGEIVDLSVDSTNWRDRTLSVWRAKTRSTTVLPLHDQTLKVLKEYLEQGRPRTSLSFLFLRGQAPLGPMTKYSVSAMFYFQLRRSCVPVSGYTAYSLRHAFAMRLFQRGVGMKAIGDLMGHRNLVSTGIYLRLQADVLREVALAVHHQEGVA